MEVPMSWIPLILVALALALLAPIAYHLLRDMPRLQITRVPRVERSLRRISGYPG
jgi:hypothetical protein